MTGGQFVDRGDRGDMGDRGDRGGGEKKSDGVYDLLRFAAHVSAVGDNVRGWPMMRQTCDSQKKKKLQFLHKSHYAGGTVGSREADFASFLAGEKGYLGLV